MVVVLLSYQHNHHPWCGAAKLPPPPSPTVTVLLNDHHHHHPRYGAAKLPPPPPPMVVALLSHNHQHARADEWGSHHAATHPPTAAPTRPCAAGLRPHKRGGWGCIASVFATALQVRRRIASMPPYMTVAHASLGPRCAGHSQHVCA
jgi:hypothetical protein